MQSEKKNKKQKRPTQQQNLSSLDSFYPIEPLLAESMSLYSCLLEQLFIILVKKESFKLFHILVRNREKE
jgi:hypothetical protein